MNVPVPAAGHVAAVGSTQSSTALLESSSGAEGMLAFGTFLIDDREYALSARAVKEVVNEPTSFTRILPSPDYFCGVFNLRGHVVPVVDLRILLGLPPTSTPPVGRKIAIVEHGKHFFGLLVDATGDVVTLKRDEHYPFLHDRAEDSSAIINGVFMRDQGGRAVQVLDPCKLIYLDGIPRVAGSLASALSKASLSKRRRCLSFDVGDCVCAFDMSCIKEVVDLGGIENVALGTHWTLGTIDLRGTTVPVIDLRAFLNGTATTHIGDLSERGFKLIVLRVGKELLGFVVDRIIAIVPFRDNGITPFPPVGLRRGDMVKGCLTMEDATLVLLLDHERVLTNPELLDIAEGFGKVFREGDASIQADRERSTRMKTYITFAIQSEFALDIRNVDEVLNFPGTVARPPNAPCFIEGIVNLRGDLIPIINPRRLYGLDPIPPSSTRLMIFSSEGAKYGIMVDRVGSIFNVSDVDAHSVQPHRYQAEDASIGHDVSECVINSGGGSRVRPLLVLDLSAILQRCASLSEPT